MKKPMGLFRLEGLDAGMPAVLFAEGFQRWGKDLANDMPVMVAGEYRLRENDAQIEVQELVHLSQAPGWYAKQVYLHLTQAQADPERVARLRRICEDHKGSAPLVVCLEFPAGQRVYLDSDSTFRVNASHAFVRAIGQEIGEERVYVQVIGDVVKHPLPKRNFRREG